MRYFLDTSALVKIYHREPGSDAVLSIYNSGNVIFISELSRLEFASTIYRKFRNKEIDENTLRILEDKFLSDIYNRFRIIPLASSLIDVALDFITEHGRSKHLFTLDAIQLAFFSLMADDGIFVCGDIRLNSLAKQVHFNILEVGAS
jgi:predicted nucleic acid-binding protein